MSIAYKALEMLHLDYIHCVNDKMSDFINVENSKASKEKEWCIEQKEQYLDYMKVNFQIEYENLVKLESNNY